MARPLYTAPLAESSTARRAVAGKLPLMVDHVEIVPSSVAKRNCAGVPRTRKSSAMGLNTMPVGVEGKTLPEGVGMPTAEGIAGLPAGSTTLALPRLLTAIQKDWPGSNASPRDSGDWDRCAQRFLPYLRPDQSAESHHCLRSALACFRRHSQEMRRSGRE